MRVDLLRYDLAPDSVAQAPAADPLSARLLDLPATGPSTHLTVGDLAERIPRGSLLVVNDTRVLKARLLGHKRGSGGKAEVFLVKRTRAEEGPGDGGAERWWALCKASKAMRPGMVVDCGDVEVRVVARENELYEVELTTTSGTVRDAVERTGHVPLPPYIRRDDVASDSARYQTIFARSPGAVAAPTAGLHLTHGLVARLLDRGCTLTTVTLHVGLGTFQPVTAEDLDDHAMHTESFEVPPAAVDAVADARLRGAPVVAIGTTVVRTLESASDPVRPGHVVGGRGETRLLIQPGYRFRVTDRLFTNFHLPQSTLLALVCAFAGTQRILDAYADARDRGYRFFSYGDATLLTPCAAARRAPFAEVA